MSSTQAKQRINGLVSRQLAAAGEDQAVTLELCELIRRGHGEDVLSTVKDPLKHGTPDLQRKVIALLNRCVHNSGPEFVVMLSHDSWTERLFRVAKTTAQPEIRDDIMRVVIQWSKAYNAPGLRACVVRMSNSKTLGPHFQRVASEIEAQTLMRNRMQGSSAVATGSPAYPSGGTPLQGYPVGSVASASSQPPAPPSTSAAARQRQHQDPSAAILPAIEEFLMTAQGDLAMLEYGLERPDMLDEKVAQDCRAHKRRAAQIVEQYPDLPADFNGFIMAVLEQLNNSLSLFDALVAADSMVASASAGNNAGGGGGGSGAGDMSSSMHHRSASRVVEGSDVEDDSDDDDERRRVKIARRQNSAFHSAAAQAEMAAMQIESNAAKLLEQERREAAKLRKELEDLRQAHEELGHKAKDYKEKNKKAVSYVSELTDRIELLERERAEQASVGAAVAVAPPQIVEKIVEIKPVVSRDLVNGVRNRISTVKRDLRQLRNDAVDMRKDLELQVGQVSSGVAHIVHAAEAERAQEGKALQWIQELYRKEVKLRKQYYNTIQDLKGNIRVYCRVRPMSEKELRDGHEDIVTYPQEDELRIADEKGRMKSFEFDKVFSPKSTQEQVFEDTCPLIDSVVDGYSVCIFAYGQTGSGKTFTMNGYEDRGINKRALDRLFQCIREREESEESTVHCSVLEIYLETIRDLLVPRSQSAKQTYEVKTNGPYGHYVTNLSEREVKTPDEIEDIMNTAISNRSEGKTDMNLHSSRSHMIVYIVIKTRNKHTGAQSYGKLSLVDLAGSERLDKSGAEGVAAKEAMSINKSLSALGGVISGLSNQAKHIPFRDSQLTFLLQDSMGGQAKVLMFCCVSPASYNSNETLSSLGFATRARGVSLGQVKKNVVQ